MEHAIQPFLQTTQTRLAEVSNKLLTERDQDKAKRMKKEQALLQKTFEVLLKIKTHYADRSM